MKRFFLPVLSLLSVIFGVVPVFAQENLGSATRNLNKIGGLAGTTQTDLGTLVGFIINAALTLVGIIFLILTVYAGYLWLTSRGDESQIDKSKKILSASVIGLVITMGAYAISKFITTRFG